MNLSWEAELCRLEVVVDPTLTMGTYSSGAAGWIRLDISITALTNPVTFSYTLSLERSRLAVGGGLISWGCSCTTKGSMSVTTSHENIHFTQDFLLEIIMRVPTRGQRWTRFTHSRSVRCYFCLHAFLPTYELVWVFSCDRSGELLVQCGDGQTGTAF